MYFTPWKGSILEPAKTHGQNYILLSWPLLLTHNRAFIRLQDVAEQAGAALRSPLTCKGKEREWKAFAYHSPNSSRGEGCHVWVRRARASAASPLPQQPSPVPACPALTRIYGHGRTAARDAALLKTAPALLGPSFKQCPPARATQRASDRSTALDLFQGKLTPKPLHKAVALSLWSRKS